MNQKSSFDVFKTDTANHIYGAVGAFGMVFGFVPLLFSNWASMTLGRWVLFGSGWGFSGICLYLMYRLGKLNSENLFKLVKQHNKIIDGLKRSNDKELEVIADQKKAHIKKLEIIEAQENRILELSYEIERQRVILDTLTQSSTLKHPLKRETDLTN